MINIKSSNAIFPWIFHKKTFENVHLMNNHIMKIQIPVINNM